MENWKAIFNLVKDLSGSKNALTLHPAYCRMMDESLSGGVFLAQCIYLTGKGHDPEGWFYKTYDQWQSEYFISKHEVRKYADKCQQLGFLETEVRKVGKTPKLHYRIDFEAFAQYISSYFSHSDFPDLESLNLDFPNLESQKMESPGLSKNGKSLESPKMESPIYTPTTTTTTNTTTTPPPPTGGGGGVGRNRQTDLNFDFVCRLVEENFSQTITPVSEKIISDWMDQYPAEHIEDAINVSVKNNRPTLAYAGGVLSKQAGRRDYGNRNTSSNDYGPGDRKRYEVPDEFQDIVIG